MADRCPGCRRTAYRGTTREVRPDECALEDGASCRAYRHGYGQGVRELGAELSRHFDGAQHLIVLDAVVEMEGGHR